MDAFFFYLATHFDQELYLVYIYIYIYIYIYGCPSNAEVENLWSFSSTLLYICMAWCLIKNEVA